MKVEKVSEEKVVKEQKKLTITEEEFAEIQIGIAKELRDEMSEGSAVKTALVGLLISVFMSKLHKKLFGED